MSPLAYQEVAQATAAGWEITLAVFPSGRAPIIVSDAHPNFAAIRQAVQAGNLDEVLDLKDVPQNIRTRFQRLTDRVTIKDDQLLFDGDPIGGEVVDYVFRLIEQDPTQDIGPVVRFLEKIWDNPSENSRQQAFGWLRARHFTLTFDGDIIAYKGLTAGKDGVAVSQHAGHAYVDDTEYTNVRIPNPIGSVVWMPRSEVMDDPHADCHKGLHVGTYHFAKAWDKGSFVAVKVNPRDIVSVPYGDHGYKIRVCRYEILCEIDEEITEPLYHLEGDNEDITEPESQIVSILVSFPDSDEESEEWDEWEDEDEEDEDESSQYPLAPTEDQWREMVERAKRRRQNFAKYAMTVGKWSFIGIPGDHGNRFSWIVRQA